MTDTVLLYDPSIGAFGYLAVAIGVLALTVFVLFLYGLARQVFK